MNNFPLTRDLVLIGGGHTHALVLRAWGMEPLAGVRVTLINPGPTAPYSGMLPGFVAGHYSRSDLDIDLVRLARFARARIIDGAVTGIDPGNRQITVPGRPPVGYDVCSVDVGITSTMPDVPGFAAHAVPAKPLGAFASRWDRFRDSAQTPQIAIIGGGVAGVELAMAMAHALRGRNPVVRVIDRGRALSALGDAARRKMLQALSAYNIELIEKAEVSEVFADGIVLKGGRIMRSDFTTGAAGARPHDWLTQTGLDLQDGYIAVSPTLQSSDPAVFAVGDCAHMRATPRPKAGVYAVRQAPVLHANLRAVLSGTRLRPYRPQRDYLKLISLGRKSALAEKLGFAPQGPLLWRLKDRIDRTFMDQFDQLAPMAAPALPRESALGLSAALGNKPLCGGCGAKVGRAALQRTLGDSFGDDAALVQKGQVISTDHLRAMIDDPTVMTRIALAHALNDIWAMGARPQVATISLILPRMSPALQERTLREITATANAGIEAAGGRIVGGHTSLGAELTTGFTITGLADAPIGQGGAAPGDRLILTKPIGSGTIMAADMALQAEGRDVMACLTQMMQDQGAAAAILADARAMTDVTGFGLAGHLRGMCDASGTGAAIDLAAIPIMQGAMALADAGVRSSLYADNLAGAGAIKGPDMPLLYDPQTAGGLLAAVPADQAQDRLTALQQAGYDAAIIGQIMDDGQIRTH